jgi:dihydroflavonol-4-reductase
MTTVVTGASGHIGANLIRILLSQNRPVRVILHQDRRAIKGLDIDTIEGDVSDLGSLCQAFEGADVVYHLAVHISLLMSEWSHLESINIKGTRNVVEACLRKGVRRLVHFSSIHAHVQQPFDVPVDESRPLIDSTRGLPYDRSKAAGEREVLRGIDRGLDAIIVNPTGGIGPHDYKPSHFGEVLLALANGKMPALVESGFDWVDVRDVAACAIKAEKQAPVGAKYLLSGHWVSLCDLAAMIKEITGVSTPRMVCPMWLAHISAPLVTACAQYFGKRPLFTKVSLDSLCGNRAISHQKATLELGYQPRPFRETLMDTIKWFQKEGKLKYPLRIQSAK